MNEEAVILYGHPTSSDVRFLLGDARNMALDSLSSTSSTRSDAESAPPDLDLLFNKVCAEYSRCVHENGRVLPPEWTMPDLVRTVLGNEAIQHGFLTEAYYDVMLCGTRSWGCEELLQFLDLINYVF